MREGEGISTDATGPLTGDFSDQVLFDTLVHAIFHDSQLVIEVFAHLVEFSFLNFQGTGVFFNTVAGKDLDINNGTVHA